MLPTNKPIPASLVQPEALTGDVNGQTEDGREFTSLLAVLSGTFYRCEIFPPWRMSYISQGVEELTGLSVSKFNRMNWQELMHPEDVADVHDAVSDAIATGRAFSVTYRLFHSSGFVRWVREQGKAVYGPDGDALFLEGMISDVSEEQNLRQANAKAHKDAEEYARQLGQVLESTSDCVFSLDRQWRFTYLNGRARNEIDLNNDLLGQYVLNAFPQLERTPFWKMYQEVMLDREPRQIVAFMPGLDHWYEVHAAPIDHGITVFFRNIDDRKHAEEDLIKRKEKFQRALDHIPQIVWSANPEGFTDYYNYLWYEFTGAAKDSVDGSEWRAMLHPKDREDCWKAWRHSCNTGEPFEYEYRVRHKSGEYRWLLGRAWPQRKDSGEIERWYGTCTDIHDLVSARHDLHDARTVQDSVLEASSDCIKIIRPDGTLEFMNQPGLRAMELGSFTAVRGKNWVSLWPKEGQATARHSIQRAMANRPARFTGFCPTASGKHKWWDVVVTPIRNEQGKVTRLLCISRDITTQREANLQLKWASEHDALTNLPNRRAFQAHLQAAIIRAMQSGEEIALLLVDLDHFKHINDTLGHAAGDHLLKEFACRLSKAVRGSDFVARLGGDEFAILLESAGEGFDPVEIGNSIIERLREPVYFEGRYLSGCASIGGAVFPTDAKNAIELFTNADIALYALKDGGRGGTRMFQSQMRDQTRLVASQLSLARAALSEESVEPYYQQKVELKTGRIAGFEALLRWNHGTQGVQKPDTVLEAFRDYELAAKIGELMQCKVFRDLRSWLDRGVDVGYIALNAAPVEFLRDDFAERFIERMSEHSVPPSLIELEVTERVFLDSESDCVGSALSQLKSAGVRIALDDFGTGHSALSHLKDFPVDVVKIDRSFVELMVHDDKVRAIVTAVIDLARNLQIDVVAEGIETELQKRMLANQQCLLGQGFYFGRPVAATEIPLLVSKAGRRLVA